MTAAELAATVVAELVRQGVREAVLSPGSRSAPLAFALYRANERGELRLHVRIDERGAGFLALGLAAATNRPVPVVCTSGTAAANLHPAVLEASHRGVPLLVLTSDRPAELVGTGANQTTDQSDLYGTAVRWKSGLDSHRPAAAPAVARAVGWATGALSGDPGPVHLNVALAPPLTGYADPVGPPGPVLPVRRGDDRPDGPAPSPKTLLLAGDGAAPLAEGICALVRETGWPVIAEPSAGLGAVALPHGVLLLDDESWTAQHRPDRVVVVGNPTLHRSTQRILADDGVEVVVVATSPRWPDAARRAGHVVTPGWLARTGTADPSWARDWADAATRLRDAVPDVLTWPSGLAVAREVLAALPALAVLQVGSSNPIRDLDLAAEPRADVTVVSNRGLAGIDGTVSSAIGLALARPDAPAYALVGDLTLLHDVTGLIIGPGEPRPDLMLVVFNDDGGGIFGTLEYGADPDAAAFERLFGTPTGADLAAVCRGAGVEHHLVATPDALRAALTSPPDGVTVLEVRSTRAPLRDQHVAVAAAVRAALG